MPFHDIHVIDMCRPVYHRLVTYAHSGDYRGVFICEAYSRVDFLPVLRRCFIESLQDLARFIALLLRIDPYAEDHLYIDVILTDHLQEGLGKPGGSVDTDQFPVRQHQAQVLEELFRRRLNCIGALAVPMRPVTYRVVYPFPVHDRIEGPDLERSPHDMTETSTIRARIIILVKGA